MSRRMRWTIATLTFLVGLLAPNGARAEHGYRDCPGSSYSSVHYWAPQLYRVYACRYGPKMNTYAPDRHPEIEPSFKLVRFRCPPVPAQQSSVDFYFSRGLLSAAPSTQDSAASTAANSSEKTGP
jgi:hypothetical protein